MRSLGEGYRSRPRQLLESSAFIGVSDSSGQNGQLSRVKQQRFLQQKQPCLWQARENAQAKEVKTC